MKNHFKNVKFLGHNQYFDLKNQKLQLETPHFRLYLDLPHHHKASSIIVFFSFTRMQNKNETYIEGRSLYTARWRIEDFHKLYFFVHSLRDDKKTTYIEGRSLTHPFTLFVIRTQKLTFLVGELNYRVFFMYPRAK